MVPHLEEVPEAMTDLAAVVNPLSVSIGGYFSIFVKKPPSVRNEQAQIRTIVDVH